MESISHFFSTWSPEQLGFAVSAFIFLITTLLVARRLIGFSVTLLFLLFALIAGFIVSDKEGARHTLHSTFSPLEKKTTEFQKAHDEMKQEVKEKSSASPQDEEKHPSPTFYPGSPEA